MNKNCQEKTAYLVTGGAGFIGSNFVLDWVNEGNPGTLIILDKLTYAASRINMNEIKNKFQYIFIEGDIADTTLVHQILHTYKPCGIVNFAAETHVDRSIHSSLPFAQTNVLGTCCLLETIKAYWTNLDPQNRENFRFIHISTDEVYGSLNPSDPPTKENSPYKPNNPYAASKAASDHFVRAFYQTHRLPVIIIHSTNNFGPRQFPEKLIPLIIFNALQNKPLPIYGDGSQRRSWLYTKDHYRALQKVLTNGKIGETYHIGTQTEMTNLDLVHILCSYLDRLVPSKKPYSHLIQFIPDRLGHDLRYALNCEKIHRELGWKANTDFKEQLFQTILWYIENPQWFQTTNSTTYKEWISRHYGGTL